MMKKPSFYALVKDFNTGKVEKYDIMERLLDFVDWDVKHDTFHYWNKDHHQLDVRCYNDFVIYAENALKYLFWGKCEYEFVIVDWPYKDDSIKESRPVKIDVYDQIEPNLELIASIAWDYVSTTYRIR